jgi:isoleucyl-tRNA synthetase
MTEYKETLNLPQTDFPMKANLASRELEFLKFWRESDLYSQIRKKGAGREKFILHDGPPYANGHTHIGHALNKTLKDIILKEEFEKMVTYWKEDLKTDNNASFFIFIKNIKLSRG